jgi:hypothetical protein
LTDGKLHIKCGNLAEACACFEMVVQASQSKGEVAAPQILAKAKLLLAYTRTKQVSLSVASVLSTLDQYRYLTHFDLPPLILHTWIPIYPRGFVVLKTAILSMQQHTFITRWIVAQTQSRMRGQRNSICSKPAPCTKLRSRTQNGEIGVQQQ